MSEFSPLRDPVFVLVWQVHLLVVSLFALLGIWAGVTRRPWYVAPTLFLALLWLFVPLEAPEPAVVLLLSAPILAFACRLARRWLEPKEEASELSPARWRFSLADLLWLTLLVGMLTGLSMQLWRLPWEHGFVLSTGAQNLIIDWPEVALSAACFCVVGVTVLMASRKQSRRRQLLGLAVVSLLVLVAASLHALIVANDWLLLYGWGARVPDSTALFRSAKQPAYSDIFLIYLSAYFQFSLVIWLGLRALSPLARSPVSRVERTMRMAAGVCMLWLIAGLAVMFVAMQSPPAWPEEKLPERNDREAFWPLLARHEQLNPIEGSFRDLDTVKKAPALVLELYDEFHDLLKRDSITWIDGRNDDIRSIDSSLIEKCQSVRDVGRCVGAQAKLDWLNGRRSEALEHDVLCMRLGEVLQKRGTLLHCLVGKALEGISIDHLTRIRTELDASEIHKVAPSLEQLAADREPSDLLLARDAAYNERASGWRQRIWLVSYRLLRIAPEHEQAAISALKDRDAMLAMLRTDLALRSYRQTHGDWPESLSALVPEQLPALPLDPFTQQPLVYRAVDEGFVLYSVGRDGVDSGGNTGSADTLPSTVLFEPGYDLDLDVWVRYD